MREYLDIQRGGVLTDSGTEAEGRSEDGGTGDDEGCEVMGGVGLAGSTGGTEDMFSFMMYNSRREAAQSARVRRGSGRGSRSRAGAGQGQGARGGQWQESVKGRRVTGMVGAGRRSLCAQREGETRRLKRGRARSGVMWKSSRR